MAKIKKAFEEIVNFLEENKNSKVSTVLDGVIQLASAKAGGGGGAQNFIKDADGNVTHIFCYYHKKWEPVAEVEFGKKASSPTGYNSMCKEGTSQWTKQQRAAKKANEELLTQVSAGEVLPGDIASVQEGIAEEKAKIVPREDGIGSDDKPE